MVIIQFIITIRDLVSELDNEQNILHRDPLIQSGNFKMVLNKFDMAFVGKRGFCDICLHRAGLYPIIARRWYKNDLNEQGKYVGQYPILNELCEAFQQLSGSYVLDNDKLGTV